MKHQFCDNWTFRMADENDAKSVLIPHDAMQERGRSADAPSGRSEAFFLGGTYCYEKMLFAPKEWKNKRIMLEFEGVYPHARVLLNGKEVGGCNYGYSTFRVDLEELKIEEENIIEVIVEDENHPNSRWYGGAGIYRPVWLLEFPKTHIEPAGVKITTLSTSPAKILVETAYVGEGLDVENEIIYDGRIVAKAIGAKVEMEVADAKLWSAETPELYQCHTTLKRGEEVLDEVTANFGIRSIEWSLKGLFVNGNSVLLKGGCIHHDHGVLGARTFDVSEYRRIKRMKEFGFNAVRSAHNPLSRAALEACDRLGMYVMDEAFDTWTNTKSPYDHGVDFLENYEEDIRNMVDHDYNHPSVIMYSIGNEVTEPAKPEGVEIGKKIIAEVKKYDRTRPVTAGINLTLMFLATLKNNPIDGGGDAQKRKTEKMDSTAYNKMVMKNGKSMTKAAGTSFVASKSEPILKELDICGYNYAASRYKKDKNKKIIVGSETYCYELGKVWPMVEKYPHVIGDFMWTAWDYIGEVGIGSWSYAEGEDAFAKEYPWLLADTGAFDILGNDNAEAGLAAAVWGARKTPYIAVTPANHPGVVPVQAMWRGSNAIPYWSWSGCDGNPVDVEIYSAAPQVEVMINGKSLGKKKTRDYKATYKTTYEAGEVKAVAYFKDGSVEESVLTSAHGKPAVQVTRENHTEANGIVYLDIDLVGENGMIECNRDCVLNISVEGGELLGFGSANPKTEESFLSGSYKTYYGRALAVIRVNAGDCKVTVTGETVDAVTLVVES